MSNSSRATNLRDELRQNRADRNWLHNIITRIRTLCGCIIQQREDENVFPATPVHAVDSVRLVYIRRIEEASLLNFRRQQGFEQAADEIQPRIIRQRRMRSERNKMLDALEKALHEYESKNKTIISSTQMPSKISHNKTSQISRASQTDAKEVIEELLKKVDHIKPSKDSSTSEEVKRVIIYSSIEDLSNLTGRK